MVKITIQKQKGGKNMQKMKRFLSIVVTVCMLVNILSMGVLALSISDKPANGTTVGQPFAAGTAGSTNFRIPGLVTLDNGRVVATIDARWSWAADAGGIDTLVSVSDDNGANWTYTGEYALELIVYPEYADEQNIYATWRADYAWIPFEKLQALTGEGA
jgi:hypothetical protein